MSQVKVRWPSGRNESDGEVVFSTREVCQMLMIIVKECDSS